MNGIKKEIADLKTRIQELENQIAEPIKWSPVGGGWWIDITGSVDIGKSNNEIKQFGIERPTKEQAERAAVEMRKFNRLLALRDELCGDDVVNWSSNEAKYFLCHSEESKTWDVNTSFCINNNSVYFTTRQYAQFACDMLNSGEVEL